MLLEIHPKNPEPRKIKQVVDLLNKGEVIVCPTDTVYAFVCSAHQARAIEAVAKLKGNKPNKVDLSLICKDLSQLSAYARAISTPAFRTMKAALPGPYTFIVTANNEIPKLFKNNKHTVGIRVPDHPVPLAIVEELGHALVVTSVHDPDKVLDYTTDPERIHEHWGHQLGAVIDSGMGTLEASTVVDLTDNTPVVVREGKGPVDILF